MVATMKRKKLVRDVKREALSRMEDSARTDDDFKRVVAQWDHLDQNRERKKRNHEIGRPNAEMLHWDRANANDEKGKIKAVSGVVIPRPIAYQWWRQNMHGDFIDTIFDCPHELYEIAEDAAISKLLRGLSESHKEILYYSAVRLYSNVRIAALRNQTDRNIRKALVVLLNKLRDSLAPLIREQIEAKLPDMTLEKREFLAWYDEKEKATVDSGGE